MLILEAATEPPTQKHSGLGGLKRLGTVIGRRKSMIPARASSVGTPEKEKRSFRPFGRRGESDQSIPNTPSRGGLTTITSNEERPPSQLRETPSRPQQVSRQSERELPRTPDPDAITPAPLNNQAPTTNGILANNYPVLQPNSAATPSASPFSSSSQVRNCLLSRY
jgi:F-BAR domain only protein